MSPEAFAIELLTRYLGFQVYGSIPAKIPDPFVLVTPTGAVPVPNASPVDSVDETLAVAVSGTAVAATRNAARNCLIALHEAYEASEVAAGARLAYFEAQMLPVRRASADSANTPQRVQYDALYRLILTA